MAVSSKWRGTVQLVEGNRRDRRRKRNVALSNREENPSCLEFLYRLDTNLRHRRSRTRVMGSLPEHPDRLQYRNPRLFCPSSWPFTVSAVNVSGITDRMPEYFFPLRPEPLAFGSRILQFVRVRRNLGIYLEDRARVFVFFSTDACWPTMFSAK